jgi:hypothetical protein
MGGVPAVKVKVVVLIVAGFIASLKVAVTTALGHMPTTPLRGVSEVKVGGVTPGLALGLQHPGLKTSSKNAMNHVLLLLYLPMTVILLLSAQGCKTVKPQSLKSDR